MEIVNIHAAKTNLSKLIVRAVAGEDIVIARAGEAMVRLTPVAPATAIRRKPGGRFEGLIGPLGPEFWEPLSDDELKTWGQI